MTGYLKFYRSVKFLQRQPFCVKSLFQAVMLALTNYLTSVCEVGLLSFPANPENIVTSGIY